MDPRAVETSVICEKAAHHLLHYHLSRKYAGAAWWQVLKEINICTRCNLHIAMALRTEILVNTASQASGYLQRTTKWSQHSLVSDNISTETPGMSEAHEAVMKPLHGKNTFWPRSGFFSTYSCSFLNFLSVAASVHSAKAGGLRGKMSGTSKL